MSYGHCYGRAMMQGAIHLQYGALLGCVSQRRISKSLQRVAPIEFDARRRDISEKTYPIPYYASYFGYKIHMDQNEKTTMLWVHTCCHDRCLLTNGLWIWDDGNKESNSYIRLNI